MSAGYLYCFRAINLQNIYKVSVTSKTPEQALEEIRSTPIYYNRTRLVFSISLTQPVKDIRTSKENVYQFLRINSEILEDELFRTSLDIIQTGFEFANFPQICPSSGADTCLFCLGEESPLIANLKCSCKWNYHSECYDKYTSKDICPICKRHVSAHIVIPVTMDVHTPLRPIHRITPVNTITPRIFQYVMLLLYIAIIITIVVCVYGAV